MSTRLTDEQRERIRCDYERWGDTRAAKHIPTLLSHVTALEEELKAAQESIDTHLCLPKKVRDDAINNFRAQLVEAVRGMNMIYDRTSRESVIQLIQTFELEKSV